MATIEKLQAAYAAALRELTPPGYCAVVRLEDPKGTKKRKNAGADRWDPASGKVSITFEKVETPLPSVPAEKHSRPINDAVRALDVAERTAAFVALKWFRDSVLTSKDLPWAANLDTRQTVIKEAIDRGLFLTGRAPNPKSPAYPTTTIRLNRHLTDVQAILNSVPSASARIFAPVRITGEPLSATVLRERR